jgi:hypothetical protein
VNVWTHVVGCVLLVVTTLLTAAQLHWFKDPRSWPVIGFSLGCVISNAFSAAAHLLHSK